MICSARLFAVVFSNDRKSASIAEIEFSGYARALFLLSSHRRSWRGAISHWPCRYFTERSETMRRILTILATALLASTLLASAAEARGGGGGGHMGGFGGGGHMGGFGGGMHMGGGFGGGIGHFARGQTIHS